MLRTANAPVLSTVERLSSGLCGGNGDKLDAKAAADFGQRFLQGRQLQIAVRHQPRRLKTGNNIPLRQQIPKLYVPPRGCPAIRRPAHAHPLSMRLARRSTTPIPYQPEPCPRISGETVFIKSLWSASSSDLSDIFILRGSVRFGPQRHRRRVQCQRYNSLRRTRGTEAALAIS
jgi:hypothetical protein